MRIDVTLPAGWHEVTGKQLVQLAGLFLKHREKPGFLVRCFFLFSGWKVLKRPGFSDNDVQYYWFKCKRRKFAVEVSIFHALVKKLEWVISGFQLPASMPPVRGFKPCNVKLYNVPLGDYLAADNLYSAFVATGNRQHLTRLFNLFYKRERWFSVPSETEKYAGFLWFSGARHYLVNRYPYLFPGAGSADDVSPEETVLSLLFALNNDDVTLNEKILKTHVHECFHSLNKKIEYSKPKNNV